jgi:hypothetical protein
VIGQSFPCKKEEKHLRGYKMRRKKNMIAPDSILFNFSLCFNNNNSILKEKPLNYLKG